VSAATIRRVLREEGVCVRDLRSQGCCSQ
jgi:hypothetical protein